MQALAQTFSCCWQMTLSESLLVWLGKAHVWIMAIKFWLVVFLSFASVMEAFWPRMSFLFFFKHSLRDQAHALARCLSECKLLLVVLCLTRVLKVSARPNTGGGFSQDCITFIPPGTGSNSLFPIYYHSLHRFHAQSPPLSDLPYCLQAAVAREASDLIWIEATWSAADSKPTS